MIQWYTVIDESNGLSIAEIKHRQNAEMFVNMLMEAYPQKTLKIVQL